MPKRQQPVSQDELLALFDTDQYTELIKGDAVYVKQWDSFKEKWTVRVFTRDSFKRFKKPRIRI